jgi:hypothetical protein
LPFVEKRAKRKIGAVPEREVLLAEAPSSEGALPISEEQLRLAEVLVGAEAAPMESRGLEAWASACSKIPEPRTLPELLYPRACL